MKMARGRLRWLLWLSSTFAVTTVFSQTTRVWTNQFPAHATGFGDLATATNWSPNGLPSPTSGPDTNGVYGDELLFDGRTTGDLSLTADTGMTGFSGIPNGLRIHLTSNQTNAVNIYTLAAISGGPRRQSLTIDSGAGSFSLGNYTTNLLDMIMGGVAGQVHNFINNSTNPAVIYPNARWRFGGGGAHPFVFTGSGNWTVSNTLITAANSPTIVTKSGTGTMTWFSTNLPNNSINSTLQGPMTINDGTLMLKSSGCFPTVVQAVVLNGGLLRFDAPSFSDTFLGVVSGPGPIEVSNGMLTLSSPNSTFSGNITLSGGKLVAGVTETVGTSGPLGVGGIISFSGGTLAYSANNAFDYSSRFSTAADQDYSIDTADQNVTFATSLSSTGGTITKLGTGTLTLSGTSTYSELTTISAGTLVFQGPKTGSGDITVADGATLGVKAAGLQVTSGTLTLGTSVGANLVFDNVSSTTIAPLASGTLSSSGTTAISINSGTFGIGQSYPLLTWASGSAPAVSLGSVNGASGTLSTNGSTIQFNVTLIPPVWTGASSGNWSDPGNWTTTYSDSSPVVFNDTASGTTSVIVDAPVQPAGVTVNNSSTTYSITSSGGNNIAGSTGLAKSGTGTLTLSGAANTYTGVTTISGGTVIVSTLANGGSPSDIGAASSAGANLVFNGGTLRYTGGGASSDRLFTVGLSGGTIDSAGSGALTLINPGPINLAGLLALTGSTADTNTLASALTLGGGLVKNGMGTWVLAGTNAYGGGTTISAGVLQVGANGGTGTLGSGGASIAAGAALDFQRTGIVTVNGVVSGNGAVSQSGSGTVVLANNNTYSGGTTINAGTLQVGNGGASGSLNISGAIVNNATLVFNTSGAFTYIGAGVISGTGNVVVQGGGHIKAIGANTYTGWTRIDAATTFQPCQGNTGQLLSSVVTNNGILRLIRQDSGVFIYNGPIVGTGRVQVGINSFNFADVTLTGTNTYTGGTFIGGNSLVLGDGITPGAGAIVGNVQFVNNFTSSDDNPRTLIFNRPDDFTFGGTITTNFTYVQNNLGIVQQNGAGTLTLTANNTYAGGTVINAGALQVGNGGATGTIGFGPVTLNSTLIVNRTGTLVVGTVTGAGALVKRGSGTVTLTGNSTAGTVVLAAGTLAAAAPGAIGSLTVAGDLTIVSGGTLSAGLDRSSSPSNSVYSAATITHTNGGIVRLINGGPALQVGDKFTIFNQAVTGGASMTIVSPGFSVQNNLAVDGSVTVNSVLPAPTITATVANGTNLNLSWPSTWTGGVFLQGQTNTLMVGISNNWVAVLGTDTSNTYSTQIRLTNQAVFYRLVSP